MSDPGGDPLNRFLGQPLEISRFLRIAIGIAATLGSLHARGIIHRNVKPPNILVNPTTGEAWLWGFCLALRVPRQRPAAELPTEIAGTLAYMAPEQTGRMNRSIDSRSDLYAYGVTLYEMLTGRLPFTANDPMGLIHCHVARQPVPPAELVKGVPEPVSAIIVKLLAKTPEERYQTAAGVEADLRACWTAWESAGRIDPISLGERDVSDRIMIPEKLYGREPEVEILLSAFNRVSTSRVPELVLLSGYSGVGKSSIVHELHKHLIPRRGLFALGKFDRPSHPLSRTLRVIGDSRSVVQEIAVRPLSGDDVTRLVTDSLHCEIYRADPLARLIHEKTGGNPLFTILRVGVEPGRM
jgi:serine/threonine protein kinase